METEERIRGPRAMLERQAVGGQDGGERGYQGEECLHLLEREIGVLCNMGANSPARNLRIAESNDLGCTGR